MYHKRILHDEKGNEIIMDGQINRAGQNGNLSSMVNDSFQKRDSYTPCVKNVLDYLDANFSENISIAQLSSDLFISTYYLMRIFKQETGKTIHEYLTERRMRTAVGMIRNGFPIFDIIEMVGYSDYSLFYKNFCKYMGVSPKEYQKEVQVTP